MRDGDIDIVEIIINNMPQKTDMQKRIKFYMECHKSNCNNFIYSNFKNETTMFNSLLKILSADLGREIFLVLNKKEV